MGGERERDNSCTKGTVINEFSIQLKKKAQRQKDNDYMLSSNPYNQSVIRDDNRGGKKGCT